MKFKILNFKFKILGIFLFSILLFCYPANIYADSPSLSLTISPPVFELLLKPGASDLQKFILKNTGQDIKITPKILEYSQEGIDPDSSFQQESWIELKTPGMAFNDAFELPSNSQKEILLEIHPSNNVTEGEYNRILLFTTAPPDQKNQSESLISESIGSILLITVSKTGNIQREAKIVNFNLPLIQDSFSPLRTDIYLLNSGQGLIRPTGKIAISSPIFKASYSVNTFTLFSGERKILKTDTSNKSPHGSNTLYLPGFYIGKYDIEISLSIGDNISKIVTRRSFYAFPWKIVSLLIVFLAIFLIIKRIKNRNKITPPSEVSR